MRNKSDSITVISNWIAIISLTYHHELTSGLMIFTGTQYQVVVVTSKLKVKVHTKRDMCKLQNRIKLIHKALSPESPFLPSLCCDG